MIARILRGQAPELVRPAPVDSAGIDDHAANRRAVAGQELGRRMDDEVGTPVQRPAELGCRQVVVDDQGYPDLVRDVGDSTHVHADPPGDRTSGVYGKRASVRYKIDGRRRIKKT